MNNQPVYQSTQVTLPDNFMQTVIELQARLECQDSSMAVIQQLNDLYVAAMDYYIHRDLRKLNHFHRKLTSLLTHPNTLKSIQNTQTSDNKQDDSYHRSLKCQMSKFNNESLILVRSMLEGSQMKVNISKKAMIQNIQNQQAALQQRMLQRRKSKSTTYSLRS